MSSILSVTNQRGLAPFVDNGSESGQNSGTPFEISRQIIENSNDTSDSIESSPYPEERKKSVSANSFDLYSSTYTCGSICDARVESTSPYTESATPEPLITTGFAEVGEKTTVVVSANAYDERTSDSGCAPDGCVAANTRDSSLSMQWSCKEGLLDGLNCEITYEFGEPQDLDVIRIAFYKGTEMTRKLKVKINGSTSTEIVSSGQTDDFEDFELGADDTSEVSLEALELGSEDWISLTEVEFLVS